VVVTCIRARYTPTNPKRTPNEPQTNPSGLVGAENDESPNPSMCSDQDFHGWAIQASIL
jgi:hypothetical protein